MTVKSTNNCETKLNLINRIADELLPSPIKEQAAKIEASIANLMSIENPNPIHRTPEKKKRLFEVTSPATPLTPRSAVKRFGVITSPYFTHQPDHFNSDRPYNRVIKRALKSLEKKRSHTWVLSPDPKHPKKSLPDKDGYIKASERLFTLHEKANTLGENKLIPVIGKNLVRMTGEMAARQHEKYVKSGIKTTFREYIMNTSPDLHRELYPQSAQNLETTGLDFVNHD